MSNASRSQQGPVPLRALSREGVHPALPRPLTSFIGREQDIEEVGALLDRKDLQLVTITGPGGVGKTRLAIEVARQSGTLFADEVVYVSLAPVRDAGLVLPAIAAALGIPDVAGQATVDRLAGACRSLP